MLFHNATILGVGLVGASLALALKKCGLAESIIGHGRTESNLVRAQEKGIIDSYERTPAKACENADLVVFATPVGVFLEIARQISPVLKEETIVTDVGSVKGALVGDMESTLSPHGLFIGGHPIAGSDRSGIDTASADLFRRAHCIVTPTQNSDKMALEKIISMWREVGCIISLMEPEEHDRIYAAVSHLPHILTFELVNTVADINDSYLTFSGQGFKDTTRIASSQPELWRDICMKNRENILTYMEVLKNNLDRVTEYLRESRGEALLRDFQRARTLREKIGLD